jgi:hypothetical protein
MKESLHETQEKEKEKENENENEKKDEKEEENEKEIEEKKSNTKKQNSNNNNNKTKEKKNNNNGNMIDINKLYNIDSVVIIQNITNAFGNTFCYFSEYFALNCYINIFRPIVLLAMNILFMNEKIYILFYNVDYSIQKRNIRIILSILFFEIIYSMLHNYYIGLIVTSIYTVYFIVFLSTIKNILNENNMGSEFYLLLMLSNFISILDACVHIELHKKKQSNYKDKNTIDKAMNNIQINKNNNTNEKNLDNESIINNENIIDNENNIDNENDINNEKIINKKNNSFRRNSFNISNIKQVNAEYLKNNDSDIKSSKAIDSENLNNFNNIQNKIIDSKNSNNFNNINTQENEIIENNINNNMKTNLNKNLTNTITKYGVVSREQVDESTIITFFKTIKKSDNHNSDNHKDVSMYLIKIIRCLLIFILNIFIYFNNDLYCLFLRDIHINLYHLLCFLVFFLISIEWIFGNVFYIYLIYFIVLLSATISTLMINKMWNWQFGLLHILFNVNILIGYININIKYNK